MNMATGVLLDPYIVKAIANALIFMHLSLANITQSKKGKADTVYYTSTSTSLITCTVSCGY